MRKKIFHNWGLKLGSLVLAFLLWLLVIQLDDPPDTKTFRGVPVVLTNTELLDEQNKVYQVLDNTDTVTVTVRAPGSIINNLDPSDIVAIADMSKLTEINTIAIAFSVQTADDVESIRGNPDVLRLNVEDRKTKWINLHYNIIGEAAEGYMVSNAQLDLTQIEITGPQSAVDQVSDARVDINVSNATTNLSANVEIQLYDAEGKLLDYGSITKNVNYVRMSVEVLATKEVPVVVSTVGTPAEGFLATGEIRCDPDKVLIAGTSSALANVNRIVIPAEDIDITGASSNVVTSVNIRNLLSDSNVRLADTSLSSNVTVTVFIEPKVEKTLEIAPDNIVILNTPAEISAELVDTDGFFRLTISGLESVVSAVTADTLGARVDLAAWMEEQELEELSPGVHRIPLTFTLSDDVEAENSVMVQVMINELEDR
ncbi:MAG: hypothetical protein J1E01_07065 [Acetatifactor sp.]|nr:hypothetical protein [Acetatifactor sp.]